MDAVVKVGFINIGNGFIRKIPHILETADRLNIDIFGIAETGLKVKIKANLEKHGWVWHDEPTTEKASAGE